MDEAVSFWRHDSREGAIAHVPDHLSVAELEQRYRSSEVATSARHYQTSWLLTQGHTIPEVSPTISFASRWVEDFWPATPRLARRRCPDISNPASDHHRAHDGRRRNGHHRPDHLRSAIDAARPSVRHREPPRSGDCWWARPRRPIRSRMGTLCPRLGKRPGIRGAPKIQLVRASGSDLGRLDLQKLTGACDRDRPRLHRLRNLAHEVDV